MIKSATATSLVVLLLAMAPTATQAEDIKDLVPDAQLADFCSAAGAGTETTATLALADGTTATGTIECEADDLIVGDAAAADELDDVDEEGEDDDEEGDDSDGEDDSEDDDSEDDDSGDSESGDDDGGSDDGDDSED